MQSITVEGEEIGKLGDGIFTMKVRRSEKFFKKTQSWAIDAKVFDYLKMVAHTIRIKEQEEKEEFEISVKDFEKNGQKREYYPHRPQVFVKEKYFNKTRTRVKTLTLF